MADSHSNGKPLVPATAYIRMSGRQQDKSPAEQRGEITKLAAREGFRVAEWFTDEAITGDSSTEDRPGLAGLLAAAKAGTFKVVLAWHTNRISREDPMDAVVFYNQLRRAGVGLWTCCEGAIDLDDFARQLLLFVNQKASNDFLVELSAKSLRGKITNAKAGGWNGGPAHFGLDRGLFDADGQLVRRLQPKEHVRIAGHQVRLIPSTNTEHIEAVRFLFQRFDAADLSYRDLAIELSGKGFPSPNDSGWTDKAVRRLLRHHAYRGTCQWGSHALGKYHVAQGGDIVPAPPGGRQWNRPHEDVICVADAHEGIIPPDMFDRVQRKLTGLRRPRRRQRRAPYPLRDLIYCSHCGQPMSGQGQTRYVCSHYHKWGRDPAHNTTCGCHSIDAARVLAWLIHALQEAYLSPGRPALVQEITKQLRTQGKANSGDVERLQKRAADLDREVGRLVKAIRTIDAAELVEELQIVRAERDRIRAELALAGKFTTTLDLNAEAERLADTLWEMGERLTDADPAELRELLRRFVSRIDCRFEKVAGSKRETYRVSHGDVELRQKTLFDLSSVVVPTS